VPHALVPSRNLKRVPENDSGAPSSHWPHVGPYVGLKPCLVRSFISPYPSFSYLGCQASRSHYWTNVLFSVKIPKGPGVNNDHRPPLYIVLVYRLANSSHAIRPPDGSLPFRYFFTLLAKSFTACSCCLVSMEPGRFFLTALMAAAAA